MPKAGTQRAERPALVFPNRATADATAGAVAGAIARFVIGPLDVLKIRFQVQLEPIQRAAAGQAAASKYTGIAQAFRLILREEGIPVRPPPAAAARRHFRTGQSRKGRDGKAQGLWRGTVPGILLTVPYTGVQFVTLQQCKQLAQRRGLTHGHWKRTTSFLCGAAAGAAATVASYPFDLLRTTLAAQGEPKVRLFLPIQPSQGAWFPPASLNLEVTASTGVSRRGGCRQGRGRAARLCRPVRRPGCDAAGDHSLRCAAVRLL